MDSGVHINAYLWNWVTLTLLFPLSIDVPPLLYLLQWIVEYATLGIYPTASIMSISPLAGHAVKLTGIIQKAGHVPLPCGSFIRSSTYPYFHPVCFLAYILPE